MAFGDADVTDPDTCVSAANIAGCEKCHGAPYLKHGYRAAETANLPEFAACKSCHAVQGIDAWPGEDYEQAHRAPALQYLRDASGFAGIHDINDNCSTCHSDPNVFPFTGIAERFNEMHTGYDVNISNAAGQKYSDLFTVSIDSVTISGSELCPSSRGNGRRMKYAPESSGGDADPFIPAV